MRSEITVYGTSWCPDVRRTVQHLEKLAVPYDFRDIDDDADGEKKVLAWNDGRRRVPTLEVATEGDHKILSNPSTRQLEEELERMGLLRKATE